jgi:hypothetical protein
MNKKLSEVIESALSGFSASLHTALPGRIEFYDSTKKKVNVQPLVKVKLGTVYKELPVIPDVPVIFAGTTRCVIQYELKRGDGCLLVFSESSLDGWLNTIGNSAEPEDLRRHSLSDAICIPGLFSFGSPGKVGNNEGLEILYENAALIAKNDGSWSINGDTKRFVTWDELNTALQTFVSALNSFFATKSNGAGSPGTLTLDISAAKTITVKTGG